ncbi:MAG: site-specific integrase [Nostoc sp.]
MILTSSVDGANGIARLNSYANHVSNRCSLWITGSTVLVMKINRHGRAKVLTQSEIQLIFSDGLEIPRWQREHRRHRTLFGVCLFSACRIRECCTLQTQDIYTPKGNVRPRLVIRKSYTKGKLATRSIPVIEDLRRLLSDISTLGFKSAHSRD